MKVILTKDISKLGRKGETVEVKPGYAKNFLFKNDWAIIADTKKAGEIKKAVEKRRREKTGEGQAAESLFSSAKGLFVEFKAKNNQDGSLYESITPQKVGRQILLKYRIKPKKVFLPKQIKKAGKFTGQAVFGLEEKPVSITVTAS